MAQWFQEKIDAARESLDGSIGKLFSDKLENIVDSILDWLGPKAGEITLERMHKQIPQLVQFPQITEAANWSACNAVKSLKDDVLDFVGDVIDDVNGGFSRVGCMLMRTCRAAVRDAVNAVVDVMGRCCGGLFKMFVSLDKVIQESFEAVREGLKDYGQMSLKDKGIPQFVLDKLPWDFSEDMDLGEPKHKKLRNAPEPQVMGAQ